MYVCMFRLSWVLFFPPIEYFLISHAKAPVTLKLYLFSFAEFERTDMLPPVSSI